ncbi:anti-sigma factor family protein [Paraburkholderia dinghuensis]|uniref:Anti-sigma factor n=1 Tax=Paraburkholderia dinghuensis TaxID=2305225 RepID=A0A3N6P225_9BURK|nr:anti-sigma factor [Paraburkholderia dinghuensis]RQH07453.1 anti-sigma factor [Paraburkholderia dinghuensis]
MNCDDAHPLVDASVDRELSAGDELRVREHMAGCAQCQHEEQVVQAISKATRSATYYRAPEALGARITAALPPIASGEDAFARETGAQPVRPRARKPGWGASSWLTWPRLDGIGSGGRVGTPSAGFSWLTGALLVLFALGLAAALNLRHPAAGGAFVDEIVSSHVRAQISGRDLDVISTDKHTVKPWFNGKIDYAPPVEDLAAAGYPLVGGRLDYVGRERVAVLIYHHDKHVIDVYVFPPGSTGPAVTASPPPTSEGYALARWEADGMTWWAVTDGEAGVLTGLRDALLARLGGG